MNVKSVVSFHNRSLCLVLYFSALFHLKKPLLFRCEVYTMGGHQILEFKPAPICEEASRTWSHNSRWPKTGPIHSLQTLQRATWNVFQDVSASGVPCLGPCIILEILLLTHWGIHWQALLQKLWPLEIQIISSEYCNSDKLPLSCINQYLLRSLFWWNGHSLAWTGSHSDPVQAGGQSFQTKRILLACLRCVQPCNTPTRIRQLIFRKCLCRC